MATRKSALVTGNITNKWPAQRNEYQVPKVCDCARPDGRTQYEQLRKWIIRSLGLKHSDLPIEELAMLYDNNNNTTSFTTRLRLPNFCYKCFHSRRVPL